MCCQSEMFLLSTFCFRVLCSPVVSSPVVSSPVVSSLTDLSIETTDGHRWTQMDTDKTARNRALNELAERHLFVTRFGQW